MCDGGRHVDVDCGAIAAGRRRSETQRDMSLIYMNIVCVFLCDEL